MRARLPNAWKTHLEKISCQHLDSSECSSRENLSPALTLQRRIRPTSTCRYDAPICLNFFGAMTAMEPGASLDQSRQGIVCQTRDARLHLCATLDDTTPTSKNLLKQGRLDWQERRRKLFPQVELPRTRHFIRVQSVSNRHIAVIQGVVRAPYWSARQRTLIVLWIRWPVNVDAEPGCYFLSMPVTGKLSPLHGCKSILFLRPKLPSTLGGSTDSREKRSKKKQLKEL